MKQIYDMPIKKIFSLIVFLTLSTISFSQVVYVTVAGAGTRNGTSWQNAYSNADFRVALKNATNGTEFWIAEGKYYPENNRDSSFVVKSGIRLYGGFQNGGNPSFSDRNWVLYKTIFDGDLSQNDAATLNKGQLLSHLSRLDNTNHIIKFLESDTSTYLDGIIFSNGNGLNPSRGGAFHLDSISSVTCRNCTFTRNSSDFLGGAIAKQSGIGKIILINCTFSNNFSERGAAIFSIDDVIFTKCSFIGNYTKSNGLGGATHLSGNSVFDSCFFQDNASQGEYGGCYNYRSSFSECTFNNTDLYLLKSSSIDSSVLNQTKITLDQMLDSNYKISNSTFSNSSVRVFSYPLAIAFENCSFGNSSSLSFTGTFRLKMNKCAFNNSTITAIGGLIDSSTFSGSKLILSGLYNSFKVSNSTFTNSPSGAFNITNPVGLIIDKCIFEGNSSAANNTGGAITISGSQSVTLPFPVIRNSQFKNNSSVAGWGGGAIYFKGSYLNVDNCFFYENQTQSRGGAIFSIGSLKTTNTVFAKNKAGYGGAIYCQANSAPPNECKVINSTLWNNVCDTSGGALYIDRNNQSQILNSIFWCNHHSSTFSVSGIACLSPATVKNSIFQNQVYLPSDSITLVTSSSLYPLFKDTFSSGLDGLSLKSCSPAINYGDSNLSSSLFTDILGDDRVYGLNIDAGAYEYYGNKTANTSPSLQITATNNNSCRNQQMVFKATFQDAGTNPYFKWQKNGVDYSNNNDSIFSINNNSLSTGDTITCVLYSSDSCALPSIISSNPVGIIVHEKPNFDTISGANIALLGSVMNYAVTRTSGSVYNWFVNGGSILSGNGTNAISILWNSIGTYFVNVIESSAHGCLGDTSLLKVVVKLSDSIYLSHDTIYSSSSGDTSIINVTSNNNWQVTTNESWITLNPTSGNSNGAFDVITSPNTSSRRTGFVTVTCGDSSRFILVDQEDSLSTGLSLHEIENAGLIIYPNPTNGEVIISSTTNKSLGTIKIFNLTGKLIEQFDTSDSTFKMNVANFPAGIYLVLSANEDFKSTVKLVIK